MRRIRSTHLPGFGNNRYNPAIALRHPPEVLPMSITTARQLARQAQEARRAAKQNGFTVQSLRRQHLID
ncbi:MAG: hypothetical protein VKK98_07040 [Cyanobacteriota bacterium]|nr:hypothetical protein [Cyanobacteriota bacterium]